jgi:cytochrome c553
VKRAAAFVLAASCACALAADPPGRAKAQACAVCHGPVGISVTPDAPHLAGQPRIYLGEQLKAFRSGKRQHEVMNVIAKPLSDDDIALLADWYSSIPIEAKAKP